MAKLIRDRSTPEKDAWWSAVQDAAKTAPKLTYERSAPMTSEDVLERATKAQKMVPRVVDIFEQAVFIGSVVDDLAAEVRELRRDRARLDWLGQPTRILTVFDSGSHMTADRGEILTRTSLRDLIDAAMGGGEKLDGE